MNRKILFVDSVIAEKGFRVEKVYVNIHLIEMYLKSPKEKKKLYEKYFKSLAWLITK